MKDNLSTSYQDGGNRLAANKSSLGSNFDEFNNLQSTGSTAQLKSDGTGMINAQINTKPVNNTGLPDNIKVGMERLSGYSLDDVKVHYNSSKPAQLQARAYAQGNNIHLGPGQEQHLPHEAWHVVQQKQGKVKPTMESTGVLINDSTQLETEADQMGSKAANFNPQNQEAATPTKSSNNNGEVVQRLIFTMGATEGKTADSYVTDTRLTLENQTRNAEVKEKSVHIRDKWGDVTTTNPTIRGREVPGKKGWARMFGNADYGKRRTYTAPLEWTGFSKSSWWWHRKKLIEDIGTSEEMKIVAHGSSKESKIGGYTAPKMASMLATLGLPKNYTGTIKIYGCYGAQRRNNQPSFIQQLLHALEALGYSGFNIMGIENIMLADGFYEITDEHYEHAYNMVDSASPEEKSEKREEGEKYMQANRKDIVWISAREQDRQQNQT